MNEIRKLLEARKIDEKLEKALILHYKNNCLALHLIPHRYRNNGFFHNECIRKYQYDLIPNLSSEEIKTLKKELLYKQNQLNRVDTSEFNIKRVKADIHYLRAYLFQLIHDDFGISESCKEKFETKNKKIEEFSEIEIFELLGYEIELDNNGYPVDFNESIDLYHFKEVENSTDFANYPELFTQIKQISFDQGGLVVMELYSCQIYKLFTSKGELIDGPCHDLDISINGKYISRTSDMRVGGFGLSKYCLHTKSVIQIDNFWDFADEVFEVLNIGSRDRLQIEIGNSVPIRIENFETPNYKNQVKLILLDENCNWITSPELVKYYEKDTELALLAVSKEPLAYSLLSYDLIIDESIQKALCLSTKWNLLSYIKEWNLDIEKILTLDEMCLVIKNNENILSILTPHFLSNAQCLLAAISNDASNIKYCSETLREDQNFIYEAYKLDHNIMRYIDEEIINQHQRIKNLYDEYKSLAVDENSDDLPF